LLNIKYSFVHEEGPECNGTMQRHPTIAELMWWSNGRVQCLINGLSTNYKLGRITFYTRFNSIGSTGFQC